MNFQWFGIVSYLLEIPDRVEQFAAVGTSALLVLLKGDADVVNILR
jgi:hypothetical protein